MAYATAKLPSDKYQLPQVHSESKQSKAFTSRCSKTCWGQAPGSKCLSGPCALLWCTQALLACVMVCWPCGAPFLPEPGLLLRNGLLQQLKGSVQKLILGYQEAANAGAGDLDHLEYPALSCQAAAMRGSASGETYKAFRGSCTSAGWDCKGV